MTSLQSKAVTDLVKDVILDLLDDATEEQLIEIYTMLKKPTAVPRPASQPPPAPTSKSGEYLGATSACVLRAVDRLDRWANLGEIADEVQKEQPAISRESISSAISRFVQSDPPVLVRRGETRASQYCRPSRAKALR